MSQQPSLRLFSGLRRGWRQTSRAVVGAGLVENMTVGTENLHSVPGPISGQEIYPFPRAHVSPSDMVRGAVLGNQRGAPVLRASMDQMDGCCSEWQGRKCHGGL